MVLNGLYPTDGQVCRALLNAIATHRDITNAKVYFPVEVGDKSKPERVKIVNYRLFGGLELIEPGLTLAVYPFHSLLDQRTGVISPQIKSKTIYYPDMGGKNVMGRPNSDTYSVHGVYTAVVQLYYLEPTFNLPINLYSDMVVSNDSIKTIPHGERVQFNDGRSKNVRELDDRTERFIESQKIEVKVLPGEEVLRDWLSLIRTTVRDIPILLPYQVRNPTILCADYPTSSWIRQSENLVFHTAYIVVQYDLAEPTRAADFVFPKPREILIDDS